MVSVGFEVFNFIYILGIVIIYYSIRLHFRIFTGNILILNQKWWSDWPSLLIGLLLGTFIPVVTGFTIIYLFISLLELLFKIPAKPCNEMNRFYKKAPKIALVWYWMGVLLGFSLLIFLTGLYLTGVIGRWLSLDFYYPLSATIGIVLAPIIRIKMRHIQARSTNDDKGLKKFNRIKMMGVIFSIMISISFIWITTIQSNPTVPEDTSTYHSARVVTFNILNMNSSKFEDANYWENRRIHLANHLETLDPDIFGVQEAYFAQLEYLNTTLHNRIYNWSGVGRDDGIQAGEFSAIFYDMEKYILKDQGTFWLSNTPDVLSRFPQDHYRICSWVHLKLLSDGSEFFVYCTHYGFSTELQIKSSILINERVANMTGDLPVIVMGDFNMMNIYPHYLFMEGFGSKPLYEGYRLTHGYVNPLDATSAPTFKIKTDVGFHIDQFFISSNIIPISVETIKESYDGIHTYSDHYPVKMECYIPR